MQWPSKEQHFWSISVLIHVAVSCSSLPSSEPLESVKRTITSTFLLFNCLTLPPRPASFCGAYMLRSILITSSGLIRPVPLLVVQPATPRAPMYLLLGIDSSAGGFGGAGEDFDVSPLATGLLPLELGSLRNGIGRWETSCEIEGCFWGDGVFPVPSKYALIACSRLLPNLLWKLRILLSGTSSPITALNSSALKTSSSVCTPFVVAE